MSSHLLLLGHRGARRYAPENTITAFDLALNHGADGFEFDVRCTRDRRTILCHDPKLNGFVLRRHTLKQLRASFQSEEETPPGLEEVLDRYRDKFLNIEVKVRGIEKLVVQAVRQARPKRFFISSFLPSVVRRLHALDNSLPLGALAQTRWQLRRWRVLPVHYVVPHYRLLTQRLIDQMHAADMKVVTWTVNDSRQMLHVARLGVDAIISDDPKLLVATLASDR